jgi:hypothetical protein
MLVALGALVIAAGLVAPGTAGAATPSAASGLPALVNGKKAGPVTIRTQQRNVASLALTKGRWLVFAKAIIVGSGGSASAHLEVDCRLKVGGRTDLVTAVPVRQNGAGSRVPILLTTAGTLKRSGNTTVSCKAEVGSATKIRDIRVTAIKIGRLTTRTTVSPAATTGSGKPVVVSAKQGSPRDIVGNGNYQTVGSIPLSAGLWWITAKGVADEADTSGTDFDCQLLTGGSLSDNARFGLNSDGPNPGDAVPFALVGIHDSASAFNAAVECQSSTGYRIRNVVINAMKLGTLTTEALPGPTATTGSGNPNLVIGYNDGPISAPVGANLQTVLTQPLPRGKWLVIVKAWFEGSSPLSGVRQLNCQLGWSGVKDEVELRYGDSPSALGQLVMQVPASSPGGQNAVLRCKLPDAGSSGQLAWIKISALKLKSILAWPL